jgi:hypothetical protein
MTRQERYIEALRAAHSHEKAGRLAMALRALGMATDLTNDEGERDHLVLWIDRLQKELEAKK